jgi:L-iditol 2-dehydrogenase
LRPYAIFPGEAQGGIASCWGGFAEYGKISDYKAKIAENLIPSTETQGVYKYQQKFELDISSEEATLIIPMKEIFSAVKKINNIKGKRILIAGAGIVSLLFGKFAKLSGAESTCLSARREDALDFALSHGSADSTVLSTKLESLERESFDILIDATGSILFAESLLPLVKKQGSIYAYGIYDGMEDEKIYKTFTKGHNFSRLDPQEWLVHEEIIKLISSGKIDLKPYITHMFSIGKYKEAWDTVIKKETLKTVITFN